MKNIQRSSYLQWRRLAANIMATLKKIMKTASTRVKCKKNLESKNASSLSEKAQRN